MKPGTGGHRERFGSCSNRENAIGNLVHRGVITKPAAHALIEIHGQHVGASGQSQRIAADAGAEIDDQGTVESAGLVPRNRLGGRLFDGGRLDPHLSAVLELESRLDSGPGQANRGGNLRGRRLFPKPGEVSRTDRPDRLHLGK